MTVFASLSADAQLLHVLKRFEKIVPSLLQLHDAILRSESGLTAGERELVVAYVSLNNACEFCYGAHTAIAKMFGIDATILEELHGDLDAADIPAKLKPVLAYAKKLTLTPAKTVQSDADAVYAAGWTEDDLFDVIATRALFNFMNRIVDGSDVDVPSDLTRPEANRPKIASYVALQHVIDNL